VSEARKLKPEDILARHPGAIGDLVNRVRAIVAQSLSNYEERPYAGWHAIGFVHAEAGYFCGLFPTDEALSIVFEHGRELADPAGILEGDYKQIRSIAIKQEADLERIEAPFRALLLESVEVGRARRAKRKAA
jgi:hypothetical protein